MLSPVGRLHAAKKHTLTRPARHTLGVYCVRSHQRCNCLIETRRNDASRAPSSNRHPLTHTLTHNCSAHASQSHLKSSSACSLQLIGIEMCVCVGEWTLSRFSCAGAPHVRCGMVTHIIVVRAQSLRHSWNQEEMDCKTIVMIRKSSTIRWQNCWEWMFWNKHYDVGEIIFTCIWTTK